jgi:hypothetical protein
MRPDFPQRLARIAPPGTLLRRAVGIVRTTPQRDDGKDAAYLDQIRQLPCLCCGMDPSGEAAHIRYNSGAHGKHNGLGKKPSDRFTAPPCGSCHREDRGALHRVGELVFWTLLGIDPLLVASKLYAAKGDLVRMRAIVLLAIAERQT